MIPEIFVWTYILCNFGSRFVCINFSPKASLFKAFWQRILSCTQYKILYMEFLALWLIPILSKMAILVGTCQQCCLHRKTGFWEWLLMKWETTVVADKLGIVLQSTCSLVRIPSAVTVLLDGRKWWRPDTMPFMHLKNPSLLKQCKGINCVTLHYRS